MNKNNIINIESSQKDTIDIKKSFDPKKVDFNTKSLSLHYIITRLKRTPPEIILHPEFQRNEVWNKEKQSRLIESILLRFPLPAFYFDGSNEDAWEVVDGLQRLSAIMNFVVNQTLTLEKLEYLTHLEGYSFNELPVVFKRRIDEAQITAYIIEAGTPTEVVFSIFQRLNTKGYALNSQEIRHALNLGNSSLLVYELANSNAFKKATSNSIKSRRMLDREFITRFITFYLKSYKNYHSDLNLFLNEGMKNIETLSESQIAKLKHDFEAAMMTAYYIFDDYAFRKPSPNNTNRRNRISKSLFDTWSVNLAKLGDKQRHTLKEQKQLVKKEFINLINHNKAFKYSISAATDNRSNVEIRFSTIERLIQNILQND